MTARSVNPVRSAAAKAAWARRSPEQRRRQTATASRAHRSAEQRFADLGARLDALTAEVGELREARSA